jgi:hypothetical protein
MYGFREFVEAGGLLSYAADLAEGYRTMKILKGTSNNSWFWRFCLS